ncbi:galanin receptor 2b-like [Patiria miniata]|uniref:G-protein coupled receptors family 1 profile domain-containing protein n=1 Tax=Patiria miniata TaxID=46514 RepID=A0A914A7S0_PATMI|nr:galanin receptor 2b-like [Patiria miniata]
MTTDIPMTNTWTTSGPFTTHGGEDGDGASDEEGPQGWGVGGIENSIPVRITYTIIACLGIAGNFIVIFALIRVPSLRNCTSYFIIHLAATDLITSIWVIPFHMLSVTPHVAEGVGGELICRLFISKYPLWVTIFASVYSMVCVTMERFFAVVYPLKYKVLYTTSRIIPMMVSCWLVGAVSNWFFFYNYDSVSGKGCQFVPWPSHATTGVIGVYIFAVVYFIPITTMLFAHWKMIKSLKHQAAILDGKASRGGADKKQAWQLQVAQDLSRMLLVVVVTYAVCWLPNQVLFLAFNLGAPVSFASLPFHLSVILALCNSCINPFIYTLKNKQFREGVKVALRLKSMGAVGPASSSRDEGEMRTANTQNTIA